MPNWCHDPPQALVYRQGIPHLAVEDITEANSKIVKHTLLNPRPISSHLISSQISDLKDRLTDSLRTTTEGSNSFEISVAQPRARVHRHGSAGGLTRATLRLDRVGLKKNWQRHLGVNYQVLWVKGKKPEWPYQEGRLLRTVHHSLRFRCSRSIDVRKAIFVARA